MCKRCLTSYTDETKLEKHQELCRGTGEPSKIVLPDETEKTLKFTHVNHSFRVPYVIYADFESILFKIEGCESNPTHSYSRAYEKHEAYSFCYVMVTPEGFEKPILYRGENAAKIFISRMKEEAEKIAVRYRNIVPMTPLTAAQEESFRMEVDCHICSKPLGDDRVMDHCHLMGKFRGAVHFNCNLQYKIPNFLPIFIHNFSGYDSHFMITELGYDSKRINLIPNLEEIYITFSKLIDEKFSFRFMSSSLFNLVNNLPIDKFNCTKSFFGNLWILIQRKGVYPYDYTDSWKKLSEKCLPPKENFFNRLMDSDISDDDNAHATTVWDAFECKTLGDNRFSPIAPSEAKKTKRDALDELVPRGSEIEVPSSPKPSTDTATSEPQWPATTSGSKSRPSSLRLYGILNIRASAKDLSNKLYLN
ncbi:hypothetical protein J437_LFUL017341 [Ladona fulva]|uniref:DNA-directed DNA polymerase n=1 Tax=Ladona fulva TaxID=123851 RepID=A0A8K0KGZ0_LADFU|nr:hypothetical protein J437_LFUL017341 [Ladona fulva]